MKYFITEEERKKTRSTCFIEFQKGKYDGRAWHNDSLCIDEEIFYELHLRRLFSTVLPQFDYFGITQVSSEQYHKLQNAAKQYSIEAEEMLAELDEWIGDCNDAEVLFTIWGI